MTTLPSPPSRPSSRATSPPGRWSRRGFVGAAAAAGALALVPRGPAAALLSAPPGPGTRPLVRSTFEPLVGAAFEMGGGSAAARVVLAGVEDLPGTAAAEREDCFALSLDGTAGPALPQGVYRLAHGRTGHDLLVVPVDRGASRPRYQVVVNRPTTTS